MTTFATGAVRSDDCAKVRFDLISPIGLRRLAETYAEGSVKYGDYNWEKGMPINDLLNHVSTHVNQFLSGDRSEDHLAHAAWGLFSAMHSEEQWPELNQNLRSPGCMAPGCNRPTETQIPKCAVDEFNDRFNRPQDPMPPIEVSVNDVDMSNGGTIQSIADQLVTVLLPKGAAQVQITYHQPNLIPPSHVVSNRGSNRS